MYVPFMIFHFACMCSYFILFDCSEKKIIGNGGIISNIMFSIKIIETIFVIDECVLIIFLVENIWYIFITVHFNESYWYWRNIIEGYIVFHIIKIKWISNGDIFRESILAKVWLPPSAKITRVLLWVQSWMFQTSSELLPTLSVEQVSNSSHVFEMDPPSFFKMIPYLNKSI